MVLFRPRSAGEFGRTELAEPLSAELWGVAQPVAEMPADPRDERDLLGAGVRLVVAAHHGDETPGRLAGAERRAQLQGVPS